MVKRIGVCCLALAMAGLAPSPPHGFEGRRAEPASGSAEDLLRLIQPAAEPPYRHRLTAARVAEVFPELVRRDAEGRPRAVRYRLLSSVLLAELGRLAARVDELEAELAARSDGGRSEPLVRIRIERE